MSTTIQHPLHLGYEGEKVKNLQEVLLSFIQDGTLTLTDGTDLNGFRTEMKDDFFGNHTADVVRDFRTLKSIVTSQDTLVDETTANEINATYSTNQDALERFVSGRIINGNNKPLSGLSITVFDIDLRSRQTLGTTTSDANGYFELSYDKRDYDSIEKNAADIQLDVALTAGTIVTSETYYGTDGQYVEFVIEDEESTAYTSEYQELATKITSLLDTGITLDDLTLDDVEHLRNELKENTNLIQAFIYAHMHKVTTDIAADVFYGLFRQLLPTELEALLNQGGPNLKSALQISVATNVIDHYTEAEIDAFVTVLLKAYSSLIIDTKDLEAADSKTYRLLAISMTDIMITNFVNHYKANATDEGFWDELQSNVAGMTSDIETRLKYSLTLALLTGNNPGMVKQLIDKITSVIDTEGEEYLLNESASFFVRQSDEVNFTLDDHALLSEDGREEAEVDSVGKETISPNTYVAQTVADWETTVTTAKNTMFTDFVFPDYVEGVTDAEKVASYATVVRSLFDKSYPQHTISAQIKNDGSTPYTAYSASIDAFLADNLEFDIKLTPAINMKKEDHDFDLSNVTDEESFIDELIGLQRMGKLTNDYTVMKALKADGNDSASAISAMSKDDFVETYGSSFTTEGGPDLAYTTADKNFRIITCACRKPRRRLT